MVGGFWGAIGLKGCKGHELCTLPAHVQPPKDDGFSTLQGGLLPSDGPPGLMVAPGHDAVE